ncbi:ribosome recycling factor [Candidatus Gottesmanbacteria bacterium RBG_16_52_11]|uniref:Ribosome-recycling factor n=1 Tax=Candidatus Gottesmanbacteria bacterium RBG_16_52_11 TaxID=1798374 RepID=A0A1F5YP96_9BACT|nr:MAG: ribosome recycling factor [Candidatus Gottesmanbacteria bacterium RBG_16_52_11]
MIEQILSSTRDRMRKAIEVTVADLSSVRSGRATPGLVEQITVSAYGGSQTLKLMEMATITTTDAKTLVIAPFDPSQIRDIEKAILEANVGFTPVVDGEVIRITIPPLSEERRREYLKLAKAKLEAGRIMVRQVRHDALKELKRNEDEAGISEDQRNNGEKRVQELTDEMIAEIDRLGTKKETELMQV